MFAFKIINFLGLKMYLDYIETQVEGFVRIIFVSNGVFEARYGVFLVYINLHLYNV